jgi:hypothetical protein
MGELHALEIFRAGSAGLPFVGHLYAPLTAFLGAQFSRPGTPSCDLCPFILTTLGFAISLATPVAG